MMDRRRRAFRQDILSWADDNLRDYPWRDDERTPFEVVVAEVLLARTPADNVESVYRNLLETYSSPDELAAADVAEVADQIESLGLQNKRGRALVNIATVVADEGMPETVESLQELPNVGPYAAHATVCFGFDQPQPIVDTNVARVYHRVFGVPDDPGSEQVWEFAEEMLPASAGAVKRYNLALLDFGALVCASTSPDCDTCFATPYCPAAFDV